MAAVCQCRPAGPSSDTSPSDPAGVESSIYVDRVGFMSAGLLSTSANPEIFFVEKLSNMLRGRLPTPEVEADFTVPKAQLGGACWLSWPLSWRRPAHANSPFLCCPVKCLARAGGSLSCLLPLLLPRPCPFPDSPWVGGGGRGQHLSTPSAAQGAGSPPAAKPQGPTSGPRPVLPWTYGRRRSSSGLSPTVSICAPAQAGRPLRRTACDSRQSPRKLAGRKRGESV